MQNVVTSLGVFHAELFAIVAGVAMCERKGLSNVIVESDNISVINMLNSNVDVVNWKWMYLLQQIGRAHV